MLLVLAPLFAHNELVSPLRQARRCSIAAAPEWGRGGDVLCALGWASSPSCLWRRNEKEAPDVCPRRRASGLGELDDEK